MKKPAEGQQFKNDVAHKLNSSRYAGYRIEDWGRDFLVLMVRYAGVVYWLAQYVTGDSKDAEDVLQETFLAVQSGSKDLKQDESTVMRLMRITVNESFAKLRQRNASDLLRLSLEAEANAPYVPKEAEDWSDDSEKRYASEELRGIVHEGVQNLTPFSRVVFLLRDVAHLNPEEIADLFHVSVPRVKSHLLRSRLELREHLNKYFKRDTKGKARSA